MGDGLAWVQGEVVPLAQAVVPVTDPAVTVGWSVFETMAVREGRPARLDEHLARLSGSAEAADLPWPGPQVLRDAASTLASAWARDGRLRITLTGGGRVLMVITPLDPTRRLRPVQAARGPHVDEPFLVGGVKHASRAPWVVAVRRSGVDEVLLVDDHGRFTEGTTSGILAVIDGVLWTAPHDGRILASTSVTALVAAAERIGIPVRREGPPAEGPWDGLYIASATRVLAPVVSLDGAPLSGWEEVGRALVAALDDRAEAAGG